MGRKASIKISGIYKITNTENNKLYIGSAVDIRKRWREHKNRLKRNNHENIYLQNSVKKYGLEKFIFEVVELVNNKEELIKREQYWLDYFKSYDNSIGYNIKPTAGSNLGHRHSEITKEKIRLSKQNISDEIRENMRLGHADECIPIFQIDMFGNIIKEWSGAREASKKLDIKQNCIWACCHHERLTYKGFIWILKSEINDFNVDNYVNINTQSRIIVQTDNDYNIIKVWDSAHQAQVIGKFDCSRVLKYCKGKIKTCYGYKWFYKDDYESIIGNLSKRNKSNN